MPDTTTLVGKEIVLLQKYELVTNNDTVSNAGRNLVRSLLRDSTGLTNSLPLSWDWHWTTDGRAEYRGKLPARISQYYHKVHSLDLENSLIEQIGAITKRYLGVKGDKYILDFTKEFRWAEGDFGDAGSCFWGGRRAARTIMESEHALAVRFYREDGSGMARAWIHPMITDGAAALFNGYGFAGDPTLKIASLLAEFLSVDTRRIGLHCGGHTAGTIYINGEHGYLIGPTDVIATKNENRYDLAWRDRTIRCYSCRENVLQEDSVLLDGDAFCQNCAHSSNVKKCMVEGCNVHRHTHHSVTVHADTGTGIVCNSHQDHTFMCTSCGHGCLKEVSTEKIGNGLICGNCARTNVANCSDCGERNLRSRLKPITGKCVKCARKDQAKSFNFGNGELLLPVNRWTQTSVSSEELISRVAQMIIDYGGNNDS